jgi:hypothetical protein
MGLMGQIGGTPGGIWCSNSTGQSWRPVNGLPRFAAATGHGGPEGVIPGLHPPTGLVQHEFTPRDQVEALSGARLPYRRL